MPRVQSYMSQCLITKVSQCFYLDHLVCSVGTEATGVGTAPGVYLREDPICGTQLENQSELRAPTADKAALYLDAALAARLAAGKKRLCSPEPTLDFSPLNVRVVI